MNSASSFKEICVAKSTSAVECSTSHALNDAVSKSDSIHVEQFHDEQRVESGSLGVNSGFETPQLASPSPVPFERRTRDFRLIPIPRKQQYDPGEAFIFTLKLNIVFGFTSATTAANLYYCQPLLVDLATSFNVSYSTVSTIPTFTQAGQAYAAGIILITPLGDLVRRRPLLLLLLSACIPLTMAVALSPNVIAFKVLSFLLGVVTVAPQIVLPYAADLAPVERRASVVSIVLSGLIFGIIMARAVGGVIADVTGSWRNVYWVGVGLQSTTLLLIWGVLPDRPSKAEAPPAAQGGKATPVSDASPANRLTYAGIMRTMAKFAVTEPILVQACCINFSTQFIFSNFWVTLTFLLADAPYHFSTLKIGVFGLVGILGVLTAPFVGRLVDRMVLWFGILVALVILTMSQVVLTIGAGINIAAVIIGCFSMDVGLQMSQVSTTSKVYGIDPALRSRMNAVLLLARFSGQMAGSAVGSKVFLSSGWRASAATSIGFGCFTLVVLFARGPSCGRYKWIGWNGDATVMNEKPQVVKDEEKDVGKEQVLAEPVGAAFPEKLA
ncbi:hypothetical protein FRB96_001804 [Tulasnella sp. 330]|nr:hypothetical protein FRB96_001804 [Tulasnella sp. 330]